MSTNDTATRADQKTAGQRWPKVDLSDLTVLIVFLAIVVYLSLSTASFLSTANLMAILVATSLIAIVACGQTFVIITGGIDLSSGSVVALSGIAAAMVLQLHAPVAARGRDRRSGRRGLRPLQRHGRDTARHEPVHRDLGVDGDGRVGSRSSCPTERRSSASTTASMPSGGGLVGFFPIAGIISLVALGIGAFVLGKTVFGSEVYAVGGNREAAVMTGIPVRRTLLAVYVISGALAGLGGIILVGRLVSAQPIAANGLELNAIAAVVIGGASLFGGSRLDAGHHLGRPADRRHQQRADAAQCRALLGAVHPGRG